MITITIERRHLVALAGLLTAAVLLVPGVSWASSQFTDVPDSNIFHDDISWLADAGVTLGCGDGTTFCPKDFVTREQMAAFMHRLSGNDNTTIDGRLDALEAENAALQAVLAGVTRNGDTLLFTGMNVQLVNGLGTTDTTNSLGNLIIGYNDDFNDIRTGSHMLVIGDRHSYTSYGGIVAGIDNTTSGGWSSITGGVQNTASGAFSSVTGGRGSTASGVHSSITGGSNNTASGVHSSVTGGRENTASGVQASVTGGFNNTASGDVSSVTGGSSNTSGADGSSIGGGDNVTCSSILIAFCAEGSVSGADL